MGLYYLSTFLSVAYNIDAWSTWYPHIFLKLR